jgi:nucleoid-associated protein EbfC
MAFDQMKMLNELRKAQKELKKQKVVVAAGGEDDAPAVEVTFNGELKIESVKIDPQYVDLEDIEELEHWIEIAVRDGLQKTQEIAAEKMKPLMGGLGNLGL